jgi:DNA-binding GntR family transcriptional regulator
MKSPDTFLNRQVSGAASSEDVAAAVSLAIHEHRLAPGTKLGEKELSEIFGVSRTIVREGLQSLAHMQLVEIQRNRGAFVAQPSILEAQEVFEARELLEPRTARSAAALATKKDVDKLKRHIEDEHAALDASDHGRAVYLSGLFHIEIARIANQSTVAGFIETLIARSSLIIAFYWRRESALCESRAHHDLLGAIAARDVDQAEALMRTHLIDLHSALDLRGKSETGRSLREALRR